MILQGRSFSGLERHCSFLNTGSLAEAQGLFATISASSGLDFPDDGRAISVVDWDQDGDLDLWMSARNAPRIRLMQNRAKNKNHFISISLKGNGTNTNKDAIGSRVEVVLEADSKEKNIQTLRAGEGFFSQDSKWLHFGMGKAKDIDHILVHWPGGGQEKFSDIKINERYKLIQGSGKAVPCSVRDSRKLVLEPSPPILPEPSQQARIPLMTRLPKSTLSIRSFDGIPQMIQTGAGGPVLVTIWASWCPTCQTELAEFVKRKEELRQAGIGILALSVDGLGDDKSDIELARKLLVDLQFPFLAGLATPELINELQGLHDLVIPLKHPLPVPASFLLDGKGQLSVIYKGKADVDDILRDSAHIQKGLPFNLEDVSPLAGQSINNEHLNRVSVENKARTLFHQGVSLGDRNRDSEAVVYYLKTLELKPKSYKTHYNLGTSYAKLNNPASAFYHLEQSINLNSEFLLPHKAIGSLLMRNGKSQDAAIHYKKFLNANPNDAESAGFMGIIESKAGNFPKAMEYLRRAIAINPDFVEARYNLGTILLLQNNVKEAESEFLQIMNIQPNYPDVLYNLGYMAEIAQEAQRAVNLYTGELRNYPNSLKAITGLARVLEKQENYRAARDYYTRAMGIKPDYKPAIEGLARLNAH
jgi:tetratricopeptide (TPR) repeat protein